MSAESMVVKAEMMIRKPVSDVFQAFVDPAITTRFWFTKSSGKLQAGQQVQWTWEMFGVGTQVDVKAIEDNQRILVEWGEGSERNTVEWVFKNRQDGTTMVTITNSGFQGSPDEIVQQAMDSKQGFTIVLCSAKAWLEYGIELNLIADHYPDAVKA